MDFGQTLRAAQKNQQQKSSDTSYYRAKFDPPKKEQKPKDKLSENIKKFLAKKEAEEKQKALEEKRKREELIASRDAKAANKIKKMLKVTKSANKSVLNEGNQWNDTAITLEGPQMPDQDDYGYESQTAADYYKKMMEKYSKMPKEEKFPTSKNSARRDIETTKERVKYALTHADETKPRQRKKHEEAKLDDKGPSHQPSPEPQKKPKPKRPPQPPPLDFNQLLKLAEKKKEEPIVLPVKKVIPEETERPMTKKEKQEFEEEKARREAQARRLQEKNQKPNGMKQEVKDVRRSEVVRNSSTTFNRIPKLSDKLENKSSRQPSTSIKNIQQRDSHESNKRDKYPPQKIIESSSRPLDRKESLLRSELIKKDQRSSNDIKNNNNKLVRKPENIKVKQEVKKEIIHPSKVPYKSKLPTQPQKVQESKERTVAKSSFSEQNRYKTQPSKPNPKEGVGRREEPSMSGTVGKKVETKNSVGTFNFDKHISSLGNKQKSVSDTARHFPPGDVRRKQQSDSKKKSIKRRMIDSESEYDSELDDFIVDEDEEVDISEQIRSIFNYDRNKYANVEDDDECMESNFAQQQKEELHSKRIGIMEDLEDMRKEKEELARKAKKKKR